jgi:ribA/ribD-fused uncharacterized protein
MTDIRFHLKNEPHGYLSNFYELPQPIEIDGQLWPTIEHYFQAQQFISTAPELAEAIRTTRAPSKVWRMAERNHERRRADWDLVRDDVMRKAVWEKFGQNPALADQLLATDDAKLVEHTQADAYWGDGGDGNGRNMLGKILMEVRARLRADQPI